MNIVFELFVMAFIVHTSTGTFKTLAYCTSAPAVTGLTYSIVNNGFPGHPHEVFGEFHLHTYPQF